MKLLLVSLFYEYRFGGAEMVARTLREIWEQQLDWRVDVLCYEGGGHPEAGGGVRRIPRARLWRGRAEAFKRACLFLSHGAWDASLEERALPLWPSPQDYDLVCCADVNALPLSLRLARRWQRPLVGYLQEGLPRRLAPGQANGLVRLILNGLLARRERAWQHALRECRAVACVSDFIRERGQQFAGGGARWLTAFPPAEPYVLNPSPGESPVAPPQGSVLFIGRLSMEKGLHLVLQAWRRMPPQATLTLAGLGGPLQRAAQAAARADRRITLLAPLPHAQVPALMARHQVVCCPSLVEESFGRTALEARAARRSVVVTDRGALPEVMAGYPLTWMLRAGAPPEMLAEELGASLGRALAGHRELTGAEVAQEQRALERFGAASVARQWAELAATLPRASIS